MNKRISKFAIFIILACIAIFLSILIFKVYSIKTITTGGLKKVYLTESEDETDFFTFTLVDQNGDPIPDAKIYIKELVSTDEEGVYEESDPVDLYGNELGTEETVNDEIVKTFTTDSNGQVILNLQDGKYKIVQLTTPEGYSLNETNEYTVDVERIHGEEMAIEVQDPIYTTDDDCYSTSTKYAAAGRSDGYFLYYYESYYYGGKLALVDSNNTITDTINTDQIVQIVCYNNDWYCLVKEWVRGLSDDDAHNYYIEKYSVQDGKLVDDGYVCGDFYTYGISFTIDEDTGNFVVVSDYTNSSSAYVDLFDSTGEFKTELYIYGNGIIYPYSIITNDNGFFVSLYTESSYLYSNSGYIDVTNSYCILELSRDLLSLESIKVLPTQSTSGTDVYKRAHKIVAGDDGSIYYIGVYEVTATFPASTTVSGEEIVLTSKGDEDGFVLKLNSDLMVEWAVDIGGTSADHIYDADITSDGGIIVGGDSEAGNITFEIDETQAKKAISTSPLTGNASSWRGITTKINSEGEVVWAYEFGFSQNEGMYALAVFDDNSFALCGMASISGDAYGSATVYRVSEYQVDAANTETTTLKVVNQKDVAVSTETTNTTTTETTGATTVNTVTTEESTTTSGTTTATSTETAGTSSSQETSTSSSTPSTGDRILQVTIPTILIVIILNVIQIRTSNSKKKRRVSRIEKSLKRN